MEFLEKKIISFLLPNNIFSTVFCLSLGHMVRFVREKLCRGGWNRGVNLPSPYFLSQFLSPTYFLEPISPSSLNGYVSFSPSSLLFPPISPSSQLFLGHFSLLPILFLPPLCRT